MTESGGTKERKKESQITVKARAERVELRCREKGSFMASFLSIPRDIKEHVGKEGPMLATVGYMLSETSGL